MSNLNQADFVGQEQEDEDNRNTSRVMMAQVFGAKLRSLEEQQGTIKEIICNFVAIMLELLLKVSKPIDKNTCKVLQELADVKELAQFFDRFEKLLNITPQSGITVFFKNYCLPLLKQLIMFCKMVIYMIYFFRHYNIRIINQPTAVLAKEQQ